MTEKINMDQEIDPTNEDIESKIETLKNELIDLINIQTTKALEYENKPGDPAWSKEEYQKKVFAKFNNAKSLLETGITDSL